MKTNLVIATVFLSFLFYDLSGSPVNDYVKPYITGISELRDDQDTVKISSGKLINLGPQIRMATIQSAVFAKDKGGDDLVFTVARGIPGHLIGYELKTGSMILDIPLDNMDGAWTSTVSSDGTLYFGGGPGHLYKYIPGETKATDLGRPLGTETYTWDLTPGEDGEIFGSTYPGCRVYRYHPRDGFTDIGRGPLVKDENYVRTVAFSKVTGKIYAGVGSHAHLIELDIKSGTKKEMLPEKYRDQEFVLDLEVIEDMQGGDRLLATVTNIGKTLVFNLKTGALENETKKLAVRTALKSPTGNKIYYGDDVDYFLSDLTKPAEIPRKIGKYNTILASKWNTPDELYLFTRYGQFVKYNTRSETSSSVSFKVPPQPISINAIHLGPDGKIWTGGYLSGSNAALDPSTGISQEYRGMSQTEGVTVQGSSMYFGIYPGGRLYAYDTDQPWNPGNSNPKMIARIPGQSRFYAGASMNDNKTLFFGSVPEYGHLGGAIVEYNSETGEITTYSDVVPQLSIVSLATAQGIVIGGTSVWGGLGIAPAKTEASLFGWDPVTRKKSFELIPVENAKAITSLINGPDGNIWGIADGVLFIFNPMNRQIVSRHLIYEVNAESKKANVWHDASLHIHPSGKIYGTGGGQLFSIDPDTKKVTSLVKNASKLAMDKEGNLYFSRGTHLWQYIIDK